LSLIYNCSLTFRDKAPVQYSRWLRSSRLASLCLTFYVAGQPCPLLASTPRSNRSQAIRKINKLREMNLAGFRANVDFSQWSLSIFGNPDARRAISKTAMLFERRGRDRGASSAAAENAKDHWRHRKSVACKIDVEREKPTGSLKLPTLLTPCISSVPPAAASLPLEFQST
jgi:hypothetical protein